MREPAETMMGPSFPKPGKAMRILLIAFAVTAVAGAVIVNWAPGGSLGAYIFNLFTFRPAEPWRAWTFVTSGMLSAPVTYRHAFFSLVGLYFLTTELERRWGGARLLRFLGYAVVAGNLLALGAAHIPHIDAKFAQPLCYGPLAAITAVAVAWARMFGGSQVRLFFVLPVSGRILFFVTVGVAILYPIFLEDTPEGVLAPIGGVLSGLAFSGEPSPARKLWLRIKLAVLRRKSASSALDIESFTEAPARPRAAPPKRAGKNPPLRVVYGGLEDELKNRKPPKDKRHLN